MVSWPCCFETYSEMAYHGGRGNPQLMSRSKREQKKEAGVLMSLQGHSPCDKKTCHQTCLLKVPIATSSATGWVPSL
jgi:hypothetical protein